MAADLSCWKPRPSIPSRPCWRVMRRAAFADESAAADGWDVRGECDVENGLQRPPRVEMSFGDLARRAAMALVVRVDRGERVGRFSRRRKAEHALAVRQERAGSRVLHDDRLSAREIAQGPIADPGVLELDVRALGAAELTSRILDVRLI